MEITVPLVIAAEPHAFLPKEIDEFVELVLSGGEVSPSALHQLVMRSQRIALAREGELLVGVAGLKIPRLSYREKIAASSQAELTTSEFPFELGWIYVAPAARGRKLSFPLCQPLVAAAGEAGVFATSRIANERMHRTLERLGFERVGSEWASKKKDENLVLFLRYSQSAS